MLSTREELNVWDTSETTSLCAQCPLKGDGEYGNETLSLGGTLVRPCEVFCGSELGDIEDFLREPMDWGCSTLELQDEGGERVEEAKDARHVCVRIEESGGDGSFGREASFGDGDEEYVAFLGRLRGCSFVEMLYEAACSPLVPEVFWGEGSGDLIVLRKSSGLGQGGSYSAAFVGLFTSFSSLRRRLNDWGFERGKTKDREQRARREGKGGEQECLYRLERFGKEMGQSDVDAVQEARRQRRTRKRKRSLHPVGVDTPSSSCGAEHVLSRLQDEQCKVDQLSSELVHLRELTKRKRKRLLQLENLAQELQVELDRQRSLVSAYRSTARQILCLSEGIIWSEPLPSLCSKE